MPIPAAKKSPKSSGLRSCAPMKANTALGFVLVGVSLHAAASTAPLEPYLQYSEDPLVSSDIVNSPYSCIFDSELTMANGTMVKVFGWYDNEWGYSCRLVDLLGKLL